MSSEKQNEKQEKTKENDNPQQLLNVAKQIKETMKDFYTSQYKSEINLQNMVKDRGFQYLNSNCEQSETIVDLQEAQEIVNIYLENLKELIPQKIYEHMAKFFMKWKKISLHKFVKKEILFSTNATSNAIFYGIYMKRTKKQLYLCYKIVKNAFRLAPDIYVVHETQSQNIMWGCFSSSSTTDTLQSMSRGFQLQDLKTLMAIASMALLDTTIIGEMEK